MLQAELRGAAEKDSKVSIDDNVVTISSKWQREGRAEVRGLSG